MRKGVFVLSLDTELAWGCFSQAKVKKLRPYYDKCRDVIRALVSLLERYEISATWDVVGHLLLSSCTAINGVKHPEIVRPNYSWFHNDWFERDPCSQIESDPIWYGRDIIDTIRNCKVPQEIGCHTFSHIVVDDLGCSKECFDSELKVCRNLAEGLGIELKSFVYPRNKERYLETLSANSFTVYRGEEPYWDNRLPKLLQYAAYVIDNFMFVLPPPVREPEKRACWNIRGSYFYGHCNGVWKLLPVSFRVAKAKRGIDRAATKCQVFHLWFHPSNLATDPYRLVGGLEEIFGYFDQRKKEGRIENLTMGALAERLQGGQ